MTKSDITTPPVQETTSHAHISTLDGELSNHRRSLGSQFVGKVHLKPESAKSAVVVSKGVPQSLVLTILVDTGNGLYDCVSEELQKRFNLSIVQEDIKTVKCANNERMAVLGRSKERLYVQLCPKSKSYAFRPLIVRNLTHPVNLSSAFCARHNAVLHFRKRVLQFPTESVTLLKPGPIKNVSSLMSQSGEENAQKSSHSVSTYLKTAELSLKYEPGTKEPAGQLLSGKAASVIPCRNNSVRKLGARGVRAGAGLECVGLLCDATEKLRRFDVSHNVKSCNTFISDQISA